MPNLRDRPNYRAPWSPGDLAQLARSVDSGLTISEIAKAMGRSQEAVRNRAALSGLLKKRPIGPRSRLYRAGSSHTSPSRSDS